MKLLAHVRHFCAAVMLLVGAQVFGQAAGCALEGCMPLEAKQATADTTYEAEQWACVQTSETKAQADACREAVRIRWGVKKPELIIKDAGADQ